MNNLELLNNVYNSIRKIYLRIDLTKLQKTYMKTKILFRKIKEEKINISCSWIGRHNVV